MLLYLLSVIEVVRNFDDNWPTGSVALADRLVVLEVDDDELLDFNGCWFCCCCGKCGIGNKGFWFARAISEAAVWGSSDCAFLSCSFKKKLLSAKAALFWLLWL